MSGAVVCGLMIASTENSALEVRILELEDQRRVRETHAGVDFVHVKPRHSQSQEPRPCGASLPEREYRKTIIE
mgnify:FL=1